MPCQQFECENGEGSYIPETPVLPGVRWESMEPNLCVAILLYSRMSRVPDEAKAKCGSGYV